MDFQAERRGGRIEAKSDFIKKLELLEQAMEKQKVVTFWYRKRDGEDMQRTIKPKTFEKVGHSTCIRGYCMLRKEDRTFAIQRISKLKFQ